MTIRMHPSSPNQDCMMITSREFHSGHMCISESPEDELPPRLERVSILDESPPLPMPVTPDLSRRSGRSKCIQGSTNVPEKSTKVLCRKRKHSTCFRRVHFQQDFASQRVIRKCIYGRVSLTEEEKKALWWDKRLLRQSVRHSIVMFKSNEHCEGPSCEEFARCYRRARELCGNANSVGMEELQVYLRDIPIRGLEQKMFPETVSARQEIIRKVLTAQDKLPSHLPPEQQSKLLRAASQNLTRGSRMLARFHGIGDAAVAALDRI
jgi:hypothetical protein